jgi:hypothetical protein
MTADAQTQAILRVPADVPSVSGDPVATAQPDAEIVTPGPDADADVTGPNAEAAAAGVDAQVADAEADAEVTAPGSDRPITGAASIQEMYEAGLAKLDALHDRWAAAMADIREVTGGPGQAAA